MLFDCGVLTKADVRTLKEYAELEAHYAEEKAFVAIEGSVIRGAMGAPIVNPHMRNAEKALDKLFKMWIEFGMTPASRTRIQRAKPEKPTGGDFAGLRRKPRAAPVEAEEGEEDDDHAVH